jgi:hypothetical protein
MFGRNPLTSEARRSWESGRMTESQRGRDRPAADIIACDALAARLRAAQQSLVALDADSEIRKRLNLRFMSICTALKVPGASIDRGMQRLDQLMADAERARRDVGKEV